MATLFKINQISAALELQDEEDKQKMFLMGASEATVARSNTQGGSRSSVQGGIRVNSQESTRNSHIVGIEKNCMSCVNTHHYDQVLKTLKIACLSYNPSLVKYEQTSYKRNDLI